MSDAGGPGPVDRLEGGRSSSDRAGHGRDASEGNGLGAASTYAALLRAARQASTDARRHGRNLVVGREGQVVYLTPDEFEAELERAERAFAETGQVPRAEPEQPRAETPA